MNQRLYRNLTAALQPLPHNGNGGFPQGQAPGENEAPPLSDELEMARHVQQGLLPKTFPPVANLDLSATYLPNGKVGGDLYDVLITPRQKVALLIFDVSGHGVPAALIGTMAKILFSQSIERCDSPAEVFRQVNSQMCDLIKTNHYLTAFLGFFDPWSWSLTYSHAAHVPPIVFRRQSGEVTHIDGHHGNFIGHASLAHIAQYRDNDFQLQWGDKILLYTDGLTDATNAAEEMYGCERLIDSVRRHAIVPVNSFLTHLLGDLQAHSQGHPLRDDVTMLGVQIGCDEEILKESGFEPEQKPLTLVIHSFGEIEKAWTVITTQFDACGYSEKVLWRAKFCICEILSNAIVHGNRNDPDKKVFILSTATPEQFAVSVIDEGDGFDYSALPEPGQGDELVPQKRRGLYLVRQYMDRVSYNARGNRIRIEKFPKGVEK